MQSMTKVAWMLAVATAALPVAGQVRAQAPLKIAVFDAQRVSEETAEGRNVQATLEKFRSEKQSEIESMEEELVDLQERLSAQALSLSAERRAELEKDVQRKLLDLNQAREKAAREFQLEIGEAQSRFQEKLLVVIEEYGRENGLSLILEASQVVFAAGSIDVTTAIVDRFNEMFPPKEDRG